MTPHLHASGVLPGGILPLRPERTIREPYVELGWPGIESKTPSLDLILFDDSGSVSAPQGSDPIGNRFNEAWKAIRLVADWTHTSRAKVAVLHFDHPVGASPVLSLNDRRLEQRLRPFLALARGGVGTSDLLPSMEAAETLASEHSDHDVRLTVFSDFQLTDLDPRAPLAALEAFPGSVHAVVLGGDSPLDLKGAPNISVTPLRASDPSGSFAAAVHRSLTATRRAARYSVLHRAGRREARS